MFWESKILIYSSLKSKTDVSKTAKTVVNFEEQDKQDTFHMMFTIQKGSRFVAWNCWKKHECKQIYFVVYFLKLLIFWLDFCFIDDGEFVSFVHYNKSRKPEKVFFYLIPVLQYLIRLLVLFYCYFYCPAKNYLFGLKWINKKVVVSFSVNLVRLQFEVWFHLRSQKGVIILPGSSPLLVLGYNWSHEPVTERKNITWTRTFPKFCLQGDRL